MPVCALTVESVFKAQRDTHKHTLIVKQAGLCATSLHNCSRLHRAQFQMKTLQKQSYVLAK